MEMLHLLGDLSQSRKALSVLPEKSSPPDDAHDDTAADRTRKFLRTGLALAHQPLVNAARVKGVAVPKPSLAIAGLQGLQADAADVAPACITGGGADNDGRGAGVFDELQDR